MGPTILFDKSFLQSLSVDESVIFDHFFIPVICPLFYVETLADLEKAVRQGRTPEQEVGIIAQKTPEMSGVPCAHHRELCVADLMGRNIPMNGQVPIVGGKAVKVGDHRAVVFEERPEAEAFRRWQAGEFLEVERRFAKVWRDDLNSVDLLTVAAGMRAMGIDSQTCKSLEEAKIHADRFVQGNDRPLDRVKFILLTLGLPLQSEPFIAEQWGKSSFTPLIEYAPFTAHALSVEMFFQIALGANLISAERPSNREDVGYLTYLPLCMLFVSSDKLHRRVAPHFLRPDQSFVWGPDLKADLQRLVVRYKSLPEDEQEKGIMKFAHDPPQDEECLVTQLWNHQFGLMRAQRDRDLKKVFETESPQDQELNERPQRFEPFPTDEQELIRHLNRFRDAAEVPSEEIDFDTGDPDVLSIQRQVHKRKGSFWQLPKDLKSEPEPTAETEEEAKMGFTEEHVKLLNQACSDALKSVFEKVRATNATAHAKVLMSNCAVALHFLTHINQVGIFGYSPIAVSLSRTYYEIVCSTMYLAENKSEFADFVKFGRLMHYETAKSQRVKGKHINILFPDSQELKTYFTEKRKQRGGNLLSWHGMTIEKLGETVGMEKYAEAQIVRSQYSLASKVVHGDSLTSLLLYDPDKRGMKPEPFAEPMELFRFIAVGATCPLFVALLTAVDCGLMVGFKDEVDGLNAVWRKVMMEAVGIDVDAELAKLKIDQTDATASRQEPPSPGDAEGTSGVGESTESGL